MLEVKTKISHCQKKLTCLLFDFSVVNTTDEQ